MKLHKFNSDTVRALCEALSSYEGTVVAVSHDETFVNRVISSVPATSAAARKVSSTETSRGQLWVLSKRKLQIFDGSFKEYKKLVMKKVDRGQTS